MANKLKSYATNQQDRYKTLGRRFRVYPDKRDAVNEAYRSSYHRDRDRIMWSKAFKRLQHKTQVFPHYVDDHYKRRLTHSLEVYGIASSLASRLGLNEILTEAIALGHDIGHTPFGHAGEEALNKESMGRFKSNISEKCKIPVRGFNHCMHAIEIVSRIEDFKIDRDGMNLTFDVRDGILKHISSQTDRKRLRKAPLSGLKNIVKYPLYKEYGCNCGSLEAQCVWFADKLCYLFGDIEDGLRAGIFDAKLLENDFIAYLRNRFDEYVETLASEDRRRVEKDMKDTIEAPVDIVCKFYFLRNKAITVAVRRCIRETEKRIKSIGITTLKDVLAYSERLVQVEKEWQEKWNKFYEEIMREGLFKHARVEEANYLAGRVVRDLIQCYMEEKRLMPKGYRDRMLRIYKKYVPASTVDYVVARNYVAGMTDSFAIQQHEKLISPVGRIWLR